MGSWIVIGTCLVLLVIAWLALTELSYLSSRLTCWVYTSVAPRYDNKALSAAYAAPQQQKLLLDPLQEALRGTRDARVLDLACGTGRASLLLLEQPWFQGFVTGIDFNESMLNVFRQKISKLPADQARRVAIAAVDLNNIWITTELGTYDVVLMLEASEFLANPGRVLEEAARALKPKATLVITKPPDWLAWLFLRRGQSKRHIRSALRGLGFTKVGVTPWRWRYELLVACRDALRK